MKIISQTIQVKTPKKTPAAQVAMKTYRNQLKIDSLSDWRKQEANLSIKTYRKIENNASSEFIRKEISC